jgi:geranylgeranyl pyrophosphate synthase/predicted secreted hydrolase
MSKRVVEGDVSDAKRSKVSEEQQSLGPIEAEERKEAESVLARAKKMGLAEEKGVDSAAAPIERETEEEEKIRLDEEARTWTRPLDWPQGTDVNLEVQDLPHETADTEWWYINGHVKDAAGKEFSFFASFFRIFKEYTQAGEKVCLHSITWAIVDPIEKVYYYDPGMDPSTPSILKSQLEKGHYKVDPRMRRAFIEVLSKGAVPLPDRLLVGTPRCDKDKLFLNYGGCTLTKTAEGDYVCHCENLDKSLGFTMRLKPLKKPVLQGHGGVVKIGLKADTMFYYFIPRNEVTGQFTVKNKTFDISGSGWYDHEFGGKCKTEAEKEFERARQRATEAYAWNWLSVQLDNGCEITASTVVQPVKKELLDKFTVLIEANERFEFNDDAVHFEPIPQSAWVSIRTTLTYYLKWKFVVKAADIDLDIEAAFPEQEFMTLISKPAFWEGRIHVKGIYRGKPVTGRGFIERHGFEPFDKLSAFFDRISTQVQKEIDEVMPFNPTREEARLLIASQPFDHCMKAVNLEQFSEDIIKPLRLIIDRGGKAWRSYAVLLCIDSVGGNSEPNRHLLAMPELMHVGSLIVDDIQDKSDERRGGPSCHKIYGNAVAINAGTSAYFMSMHILNIKTHWLSDPVRRRLYDTFMLTLSAGHSGQAFDINGLDYMMPEVVESGDGAKLCSAIKCTHLLKSGVPAGCLARMGALMGGGSDDQVEALGIYFERIGVAFQIIDDILNLRGLPGKVRAEDIMMGKITYPIAEAMKLLDKAEREWLWSTVQSKPQDQAVLDACVARLEQIGALKASEVHAKEIVGEAWNKLEPLIPDSFFKMMIRAFGWFVLERHY